MVTKPCSSRNFCRASAKSKVTKVATLLRKDSPGEVEFITIMLWDSIDALRAFAGPNYEASVIPEERRRYLSRHDAKASHYEIVSTHKPDASN
jgi:hypothetical protein